MNFQKKNEKSCINCSERVWKNSGSGSSLVPAVTEFGVRHIAGSSYASPILTPIAPCTTLASRLKLHSLKSLIVSVVFSPTEVQVIVLPTLNTRWQGSVVTGLSPVEK